jgi:hypothetical protein
MCIHWIPPQQELPDDLRSDVPLDIVGALQSIEQQLIWVNDNLERLIDAVRSG